MLTEQQFIQKIKQIPAIIPSKTGKAFYTQFRVENNILYFQRVVPKTSWSLNILQLYKIYAAQNFIDTTVIKTATKGRVNSPSIAVLMAIKCIDKEGNRI